MMTANESPEALAELVASYVKDLAVGDVRFSVAVPERIYLSHGYWRVPVHPSFWPGRFFPMAEEIALLEDRIREAEGLKIILVLAEPLDEVRES